MRNELFSDNMTIIIHTGHIPGGKKKTDLKVVIFHHLEIKMYAISNPMSSEVLP